MDRGSVHRLRVPTHPGPILFAPTTPLSHSRQSAARARAGGFVAQLGYVSFVREGTLACRSSARTRQQVMSLLSDSCPAFWGVAWAPRRGAMPLPELGCARQCLPSDRRGEARGSFPERPAPKASAMSAPRRKPRRPDRRRDCRGRSPAPGGGSSLGRSPRRRSPSRHRGGSSARVGRGR